MRGSIVGPLSIAALVTAASNTWASAPKQVLVLDVHASAGLEKPRVLALERSIAQRVNGMPAHHAVTLAEERSKLRVEAVNQILGCRDQAACYRSIEALTKIDLIVRVTAGLVGDDLALDLTLLDPRAANAVRRVSWLVEDEDELDHAMRPAIEALFGSSGAKKESYALPSGAKSFAVFDLEAPGLGPEVAMHAAQTISMELGRIEGVRVIGRDDLKALLDVEAKRQLVGCTSDSSCTSKLGVTLGVDLLVAGHLVKVEDTYLISLRLISPRSAEVQNRVTESHDGEAAGLSEAIRRATRRLVAH